MRRRRFLLVGAGTAGALLIGWGLLPPRQRLNSGTSLTVAAGAVALNGWVMIAPDESITVVMAKQEMGQGIHTAAAMLLAEELDADFARVRVEAASSDAIYGATAAVLEGLPFHPENHGMLRRLGEWFLPKLLREVGWQLTGGSSSVRDLWQPMREAGAMARATLINAASREWGVPAAECHTQAGIIRHPSGRTTSFGALIARVPNLPPASEYALKDPSVFRLIGQALPRLDGRAKSTGGTRW